MSLINYSLHIFLVTYIKEQNILPFKPQQKKKLKKIFTILSILEAGGTTFVRKKSCNITILRCTLLTLGEIILFGTASP